MTAPPGSSAEMRRVGYILRFVAMRNNSRINKDFRLDEICLTTSSIASKNKTVLHIQFLVNFCNLRSQSLSNSINKLHIE